MRRIGLIVNPIAGMGGRVGLKGTDGADILKKALELGASKEAPLQALKALKKLEDIKEDLLILTASGDMGEDICKKAGFTYSTEYQSSGETHSQDTIKAARLFIERGAELILFAGGDGTARDIFTALANTALCIGIPAGVKIHSPVYANSPEAAGELALEFLRGGDILVSEEEVIDIDEDAYRKNQLRTRLFGYLKVPYKKQLMQNKKAPTPLGDEASQRAIALDIADHMEEDVFYLLGPGTSTRAIMELLGLDFSLLGVDIVRNKKLVRVDCNEAEILDIVAGHSSKLIIAPTGGQGYLLGRGNQQLSPRVLRQIGKDNIIIISPESKFIDLRGKPLLIYTGDEVIDKEFSGYYRVKTGYGMDMMYRVSVSI